MYIIDSLYGKIEFKKKMIQLMLTPEMQRLREVRLGNINSLFLTGSSNINRFEHSVGTAYLALINEDANRGYFKEENKDSFVYAALFHDLANGPFGHAYEYIVEKQGFIPEKGFKDVVLASKIGPHGKRATCEPFFLGEQNEIGTLLSKKEISAIDDIIKGNNICCSKILNDEIDIDNIDNVYRMAFHMGITIDKRAPIELAKGIICKDNQIYFKDSVIPYLYDWYETRKKVYQILLFNPQDFAAKCMLEEVMDLVMESNPKSINWHFTDYELILFLKKQSEIWLDTYIPLCLSTEENCRNEIQPIIDESTAKEYLGKFNVSVPRNAKIRVGKNEDGSIQLCFYNTVYCVKNGRLYKKEKISINPSNIVTRWMRGDLYDCIGIFVSPQVEEYERFNEYKSRKEIEIECSLFLKQYHICECEKSISVAFHAIIDKNKTNRKLNVSMLTGESFVIGENSQQLIIGFFLRNASFGLARDHKLSIMKKEVLYNKICEFLSIRGLVGEKHILYSEVDCVTEFDKRTVR